MLDEVVGRRSSVAGIAVENPATGEVVATVPELSSDEVGELVGRARTAQREWAALGFQGRARVLLAARRWFTRNAERVIRTIMSETGKTWEDAQFSELLYICEALGFWANRSEGYLADERVRSRSPLARGKRLWFGTSRSVSQASSARGTTRWHSPSGMRCPR
jgi:acyl-CoA reductase-like NAD-dependent aldehyde dehydrogenase